MSRHWQDQPRDKFGRWTDDGSDGLPSRSEITEMTIRQMDGKAQVLPKYKNRVVAENSISGIHDHPPAPVGKKPPRMVVPYDGAPLGSIVEGATELRDPPYLDFPQGGYGQIMASRKDSDGNEYGHPGADFITKPGEKMFAPIEGKIVRGFDPYSSDTNANKRGKLRALKIIDNDGREIEIDYIEPNPEIEAALAANKPYKVKQGDKIGNAQDLSVVYGKKVRNHAHVQMKDKYGNAMDPAAGFYYKP